MERKKPGEIIGRIFKFADLVTYHSGAIVSRTVIDKDVGTVTIFAFDEGQSLSEHTAPYNAMIQVIDGEAEISIAGEKFLLKGGDSIIMPANKPHAVRAVKKFKMILTMIRS